MKKWKLISTEDISPSKWFPLEKRKYELPNGKQVDDFYVTTLADLVHIIAITKEKKVVLIRIYKQGVDDIMIQFPAGRREGKHKDLLDVAVNELEEETGIKVDRDNLDYLGKLAIMSTKASELVHYYLATNVEINSQQNLDKNEEIEVVLLEPDEIEEHIAQGKIWDAYMRSLLDEQAMHALDVFVKLDFPDTNDKDKDLLSGVMSEVSPFFIFYAEFRKDAFKDDKHIALYGEGFWKQLNQFESKPFKDLLKDLLLNASDGVRANLAWQFWQLPKEAGMDFERGFKTSYGYMQILVRKYSHRVFEDIYHFIEDSFEEKTEECIALWKKCLKKERLYFGKHFSDKTWHEMHWWPFFYNGKILKLVADKEGDKEFLKWLEFLADYPKRALIANDLDVAVGHLKTLPKDNEVVERIFEKLILRNAKYFDDMGEWKNK